MDFTGKSDADRCSSLLTGLQIGLATDEEDLCKIHLDIEEQMSHFEGKELEETAEEELAAGDAA